MKSILKGIRNQNRLFNRCVPALFHIHSEQEFPTLGCFLVLCNDNQDPKKEKTHENTVCTAWTVCMASSAFLYRYQYTYSAHASAGRLWQRRHIGRVRECYFHCHRKSWIGQRPL